MQDERKGSSKRKRAAKKESGIAKDVASAYSLIERGIEAHLKALTLAMLLDYMHSDESDNEFVARQMAAEVARLESGVDKLQGFDVYAKRDG